MKVLVAGDFAPRARLAKQIEEKRYSDVFPENLREVIKSVDFSFVNFESPIVEDTYKPIPKCGPNLHCVPEAAEAIKFAGFTGVTMANNHILDFGSEGLHKSVACCKKQGLDVVGVGNCLKDAEEILYIKKAGKPLLSSTVVNMSFLLQQKHQLAPTLLIPYVSIMLFRKLRIRLTMCL